MSPGGAVSVTFLRDEASVKEGLQKLLRCSGQLLKKHLPAELLRRPLKAGASLQLPLNLVNHLQINPDYRGPEVRVLLETSEFLAVHKPPGIHCHPLAYEDQDTVLNFLAQNRQWEALRVNSEAYDRGLLYRLDRETSGVLLLAKTEEFFSRMREEFLSRMKRKLYLAVVEGSFDREGEWVHYLRARGPKGSRQEASEHPGIDAHEAKLRVRKLLESHGKSLVLVELKTGLRHQIRAQLAALGFPILGDEHYGGASAERLFLHAWIYEWDSVVEDPFPELFGSFFDLDRALQVGHDVVRSLKGQ